jgi:hypothetical protein
MNAVPPRAAVIGMLGLTAAEIAEFLAALPPNERAAGGGPLEWSAGAIVAHSCVFADEQVQRLDAAATGATPPGFDAVDHTSAQVYEPLAGTDATAAADLAARTWHALLTTLAAVGDADLADPARLPWLGGRPLWLQTIVRGFWHPTGHLSDYCLDHGRVGAALALHRRAMAAAEALDLPGQARGMVSYTQACAYARAGDDDAAVAGLRRAVQLNPDLANNASRDPDLAALRDAGRLNELPVAGR